MPAKEEAGYEIFSVPKSLPPSGSQVKIITLAYRGPFTLQTELSWLSTRKREIKAKEIF
jgi:hypothetical protein